MAEISAQQAQELLEAARLVAAVPDLASTVITLTERFVQLDTLLTSYELMGVPKEGPLSRLIADIRLTILGGI